MYCSVIIIISIFLCMISLWIRKRKERLTLFRRYGIPGPSPNFFYGNLIEFNKERDKCIKKWLQQYGEMFGFFLGAKPYLVCADIEFLKLCQIKDVNSFYNKDWILPDGGFPHYSSNKMVGVLQDKDWKNVRSILSTCFSTGKIKMMSTLMSRPIKNFLQNVERQGGQPFDIARLCKKLAFDIIATSAFGVTTNVQNNESNKFVESAHAAFDCDSSNILAGLSVCFPELELYFAFIRHKIDTVKYMLNIPSLTLIYETCRSIINSRKKLKTNSQDLLQTIIDAEDESVIDIKRLPDDVVVANAMVFMATGYDTTSATMAWCIYYLARNPELQEKIRQEIKNNLHDNMEFQYSDLSNFQLLNQAISETLRFWQFSPLLVNRICSEDYRYQGMTIPKGCIITVPVQVLQNDPKYWNEPEKFDSERFSSENRSHVDSIIYQPFGAGPRICIGQRLAKTVIRLVLANILRSFKLETDEDKEMEVKYGLLINFPKNGVTIKATRLSSSLF